MSILVTGGAGFIGSNFILDWLALGNETVINLDKLTYAGNLHNLTSVANDSRYQFVHCDIDDYELVVSLLTKHEIRAVVNLAIETNVDRLIHNERFYPDQNCGLVQTVRYNWNTLEVDD
jgi:dTDP-glucose 4,6-dehydratase